MVKKDNVECEVHKTERWKTEKTEKIWAWKNFSILYLILVVYFTSILLL